MSGWEKRMGSIAEVLKEADTPDALLASFVRRDVLSFAARLGDALSQF